MVIDLVEQMPNVSETLVPSFWTRGVDSEFMKSNVSSDSNNVVRASDQIKSSPLDNKRREVEW